MQVTALHAIDGDLGSANKYHQEEITEFKNENSTNNRYYLEEPDAIAEIFDQGNILRKFMPKERSESLIDDQLKAVENALAKSLDKKGQNAIKKLKSKDFAKMKVRLREINRLIKTYESRQEQVPQKLVEEKQQLVSEISKVKEPVIARDFTLSLEKSFSIAYALASSEEKQIWVRCFKAACQETMEMIITEYMKTNSKRPSQAEIKDVMNRVTYGLYIHFKNRDGDPHLHAHGVVYNLLKELSSDKLARNNFPILKGENFLKFCKKVDSCLHMKMVSNLREQIPDKYNFRFYQYDSKAKKKTYYDDEEAEKQFKKYPRNKFESHQTQSVYETDGVDISFDQRSREIITSLSKLSERVSAEIDEKLLEARQERDAKLDKAASPLEKEEIKEEFKKQEKFIKTKWARQRKSEIKPKKGECAGSLDEIASQLRFDKSNLKRSLFGENGFYIELPRIIEKLTQNTHLFSELDLEIEALKYGVPSKRAKSLVKHCLRSKEYICTESGKWASRRNIKRAIEVLELAKQMAEGQWKNPTATSPLDDGDLAKINKERLAKKQPPFNKDQLDAIQLCLNQSQLNIIAGLPGTGKSTVLSEILDQMEKQTDIEVYKLSTAGRIVEQLDEIKQGQSLNLAQFTNNLYLPADNSSHIKLTNKSVIIIDEAGMVEDSHFHTVLTEAKAVGAKVILVGDDRQLTSVGRGDSFCDILNENRQQTVRLNVINRQKNADLKEIVNTMAGSGVSDQDYREKVLDNSLVEQTILNLEAKGMVQKFTKSRDLFEQIAQDYLNDPAPLSSKLVIAASNNEVSKINNKIQDKIFKDKNVPSVTVGDSEKSFFVGDQIIVTKQIKLGSIDKGIIKLFPKLRNLLKAFGPEKKITNGKLGKVLSVNQESQTMKVIFETGGIKSVETIDLKAHADSVSLGYATTVHKSQGMSIDNVYIAMSDNKMLNSAENLNVSLSRAKEKCRVFMLGQYRDRIVESHKVSDERSVVQNLKQQVKEEIAEQNALREAELAKFEREKNIDKFLNFLHDSFEDTPTNLSREEFLNYLKKKNGVETIDEASLSKHIKQYIRINDALFGDTQTPERFHSGTFSSIEFNHLSSEDRDALLKDLNTCLENLADDFKIKAKNMDQIKEKIDSIVSPKKVLKPTHSLLFNISKNFDGGFER